MDVKTIALALVALPVLAGCATIPKDAGFPDIQRSVSDRTHHLVQWRGNTIADADVETAVNSFLIRELTVDQAVEIALLNNQHLQAEFEDLGIAQADLVQAGLLKNPVFAASWRFPSQPPRGTNAEYSVAQDFLDLLVIPLRKRVAAQKFENIKLTIGNDVLQHVGEVKIAYYSVQAREQLLVRLRLIVELNQTGAELARRQFEAGTLNDLGLANQEAIAGQSKVDLAQVEMQRVADRERLNRLMGLSGEQITWKIADHLPDIPPQEISIDHLEALAMHQRLDLAAARVELKTIGESLATTSRHRYFSSVEIGLDTERDTGGQRVTGPTLNLQLPIFDQGQAQIARLQAQVRQFQRRFNAMAIDARSEVREIRDRLVAQRGLVEYYRELVPQRTRILALTLQQYNGMLKGPYDLLLAKQSEVATERAYIEAWRDYWIARSQLERAVGGQLPSEIKDAPATESTTTRSSGQ